MQCQIHGTLPHLQGPTTTWIWNHCAFQDLHEHSRLSGFAIPFGAGAVEAHCSVNILVNKNTMLGSLSFPYSGIFTSPLFLPDSLTVVVCLGTSHLIHLPPIWMVLILTCGDFSLCGWPGRHGTESGLIEGTAVLASEDIPMPIALVLGFAHESSKEGWCCRFTLI